MVYKAYYFTLSKTNIVLKMRAKWEILGFFVLLFDFANNIRN